MFIKASKSRVTKRAKKRYLFLYLSLNFFLALILGACALSAKKAEELPPPPPITEIPQNVPEQGYEPSKQYGHIALDENEKVAEWEKYFTGRGRKFMQLYLERSSRYIPLMKAAFRERGMPDELAYIAMIESGFSPTAFSRASAVGYWQFIRETGKRYNLRIDQFVDERRDPIMSTQAAASFLDSLYSIFGDWHLALASYNAGERRILNAVMKKRTRNFWELARFRRVLPKETANYIPKFIAAVRIAQDPAKYGFNAIDSQPAFNFDSVVVDKPISLQSLAKELNVQFEELKRMNPRYKSDFVPVYADRINAVRVPAGMQTVASSALAKCLSEAPKIFVASFEYYKVRHGDTLSHIARRYKTSIARIRDLNDFSRRTLIRIGQRIKVPENGYSERAPAGRSKRSIISKTTRHGSRRHVVRPGENLSTIAKRYRVSIAAITQANRLHHQSRILVGTALLIPD